MDRRVDGCELFDPGFIRSEEAAVFAHQDPYVAFAEWYAEAQLSEPDVPDAMTLGTIGPDGAPTLRTVLMKGFDSDGFTFYTNLGSQKARDLAKDPRATALFHWKSLQRQVNLFGAVTPVDGPTADAYWATRPRGSQIGAWASTQGATLADRPALAESVAQLAGRFGDAPIPRPEFWSGFRITPVRFEFWQGRRDRLHERHEFVHHGTEWRQRELYP